MTDLQKEHRNYVYHALRAGKPVPAHVLADYPDLLSAQLSGDWDEHLHPRDHGKFASKPGGSGAAADSPRTPEQPPTRDAGSSSALEPAKSQAAQDIEDSGLKHAEEAVVKHSGMLDKLPGGQWIRDKAKAAFARLEGRYGRAGAISIFAAGQVILWGATGAGAVAGVPVYVPSTVAMVPAVAMAEVLRAAKKVLKAVGLSRDGEQIAWSHEDLMRLGRELVDELSSAWRSYKDVALAADYGWVTIAPVQLSASTPSPTPMATPAATPLALQPTPRTKTKLVERDSQGFITRIVEVEEPSNVMLSVDASGHEHRGPGPGGGQFTNGGNQPESSSPPAKQPGKEGESSTPPQGQAEATKTPKTPKKKTDREEGLYKIDGKLAYVSVDGKDAYRSGGGWMETYSAYIGKLAHADAGKLGEAMAEALDHDPEEIDAEAISGQVHAYDESFGRRWEAATNEAEAWLREYKDATDEDVKAFHDKIQEHYDDAQAAIDELHGNDWSAEDWDADERDEYVAQSIDAIKHSVKYAFANVGYASDEVRYDIDYRNEKEDEAWQEEVGEHIEDMEGYDDHNDALANAAEVNRGLEESGNPYRIYYDDEDGWQFGYDEDVEDWPGKKAEVHE